MAVTATVTSASQIRDLLDLLHAEAERACCRECRAKRLYEIAAIRAWEGIND